MNVFIDENLPMSITELVGFELEF